MFNLSKSECAVFLKEVIFTSYIPHFSWESLKKSLESVGYLHLTLPEADGSLGEVQFISSSWHTSSGQSIYQVIMFCWF